MGPPISPVWGGRLPYLGGGGGNAGSYNLEIYDILSCLAGGATGLARLLLSSWAQGPQVMSMQNHYRALQCVSVPCPLLLIPWPVCPTPICTSILALYLQHHPDQLLGRFVVVGLSAGFHIGFSVSQNRPLGASSRNHSSVGEYPIRLCYVLDNTRFMVSAR